MLTLVRFQETYPFKQRGEGSGTKETIAEQTESTFVTDLTQSNLADDSILGILDELHNESDLDNSMLHASLYYIL